MSAPCCDYECLQHGAFANDVHSVFLSEMQTMQCTGGMATTTTAIACVSSSLEAAGVQAEAVSVEGLAVPLEADTGLHPDAPSTGSLSQVSRVNVFGTLH